MADFNERFVGSLLAHLFDDPSAIRDPFVIKRHTDNLAKGGDYSFPLDVQSWKHVLRQAPSLTVRTVFGLRRVDNGAGGDSGVEDVARCLDNLRLTLATHVDRIALEQSRVVLHMNRVVAFECLPEILRTAASYGRLAKQSGCTIQIWNDENADSSISRRTITEHRCALVRRVLRNLIDYSKYVCVDNDAATPTVCLSVSHKSTDKRLEAQPSAKNVICGVVKEGTAHGNKMSGMLADEYLRTRQKHMELMAQHKYGVRVRDSRAFAELSDALGRAAVTVDLLEVKHSSPVTLSVQQHSGGASRGAAFILYNSARIEKLLAGYATQLASGHYAPADEGALSDWSLLHEPEEWQLMFNYVLEFPNVVRRALHSVEMGNVAPHLICAYLSGLAMCFSAYYRRVRILDHNRKHLMDTLHCRMRLVLALRNVLNQALALLDIEPVQRM